MVWTAANNDPPSANAASADDRNGHPVLDFDDATDETAVFNGWMPRNYAGGGLTVTLVWLSATALAGAVVWDVSFERHEDDVTDLDSDSFAAVQSATGTAASASGEPQYTAITFTNAQIDGLLKGESYRLKVTRDANAGGDTMVGDAELLRVEIRES